jgi:iron-sulfur cluster assembly accessory protein
MISKSRGLFEQDHGSKTRLWRKMALQVKVVLLQAGRSHVDLAADASYLSWATERKVKPMSADASTASNVEVTEAAARRIARIVSGEPGKTALRVSVEGGGCSGFSYKFDLVGDRNEDDVAIERDGATVLIDDLSLVYMGGSVIDFVDDLMGQSFQIRNPNAVASCGCGTSFTV